MKADIELGGTDQKFNLLVGRDIQREFGMQPQVILTLPLLIGTDGVEKMSKSLDNYIGINEAPSEIFGKLMSISDELMWKYLNLLSFKSAGDIKNLEAKVVLPDPFGPAGVAPSHVFAARPLVWPKGHGDLV